MSNNVFNDLEGRLFHQFYDMGTFAITGWMDDEMTSHLSLIPSVRVDCCLELVSSERSRVVSSPRPEGGWRQPAAAESFLALF